MDQLQLARIAYEGYAKCTRGKTFDGRDMPTWQQLLDAGDRGAHTVRAWCAAVDAVHAAIAGAVLA
jgi:hypothetical protein